MEANVEPPPQGNSKYASLEEHLLNLEQEKNDELRILSDIASLVAYQQELCSNLGVVQIKLSNSIPPTRSPFPEKDFRFSHPSKPMPQTTHYLNLLLNIIKAIWPVVDKPEFTDIFLSLNSDFRNKVLNRRKLIYDTTGQIPKITLKEIKDSAPSTKKSSFLDRIRKAYTFNVTRSEKVDDSFVPTISNLLQIEAGVNSSLESNLQTFTSDLEQTEKELTQLFIEKKNEHDNSFYFTNFPQPDVIQHLPRFHEAQLSIGNNVEWVRKSLFDYSASLSKTIESLKSSYSKFQSYFIIPQLFNDNPHNSYKRMTHMLEIDSQHSFKISVFKFFYGIIHEAKMAPPHKWNSILYMKEEREFLRGIKQAIISKKMDDLSSLIDSKVESLQQTDHEKLIKDEIEAAKKANIDAEKATNQKIGIQPPIDNVDSRIAALLEESKIKNKEQRIKEIGDECKANLIKVIEKAQTVISNINDVPAVPATFEDKMLIISERKARLKWLQMKRDAMRKHLDNERKEIENLAKISQKLDTQIQEKLTEYETLKQAAESKPTKSEKAQSIDEYEELEIRHNCAFCSKKRRRDRGITKCKHTFCTHCIDENVKKERNRVCPYCHTKINPLSDIFEINWD